MAAIGAFLSALVTWFLGLLGAANSQKQTDQVAKDATTIKALKDMEAIDAKLAVTDTDTILSQLRADTAARTPKP